MITGQGNGQGGREHGQKCDQLPGQRSLTDPAAREHVARVWGISPDELPQPGLLRGRDHGGHPPRRDQGACSRSASTRWSRCPDANFTREALEKLEFFAVVDFFLSETAQHADVVLAGSLQEEEEGVVCSAEGRVIHIQQAVDAARRRARRTARIYCDLARAARQGAVLPVHELARDLRRAARGLRGRHRRLRGDHLREDRRGRWASSGPAPPRTTRAPRACSRAAASSTPTARPASR